jgi:hypothetical protein
MEDSGSLAGYMVSVILTEAEDLVCNIPVLYDGLHLPPALRVLSNHITLAKFLKKYNIKTESESVNWVGFTEFLEPILMQEYGTVCALNPDAIYGLEVVTINSARKPLQYGFLILDLYGTREGAYNKFAVDDDVEKLQRVPNPFLARFTKPSKRS